MYTFAYRAWQPSKDEWQSFVDSHWWGPAAVSFVTLGISSIFLYGVIILIQLALNVPVKFKLLFKYPESAAELAWKEDCEYVAAFDSAACQALRLAGLSLFEIRKINWQDKRLSQELHDAAAWQTLLK